jgi:hypothetical protein
MAFPFLRQENPLEEGMTFKGNSKQIKDLAFEGIGGGPNGNRALDAGIVACDPDLEAQTLGSFDRQEMVYNLEARFLGVEVQSGDVREEIELKAGLVPEELPDPKEMGGADIQCHLAAESLGVFDCLRGKFLEFLDSQVFL